MGTRLQERDGHRLKAVPGRDVVFAPELPRGNARTGRPPLTGKRVRGLCPRSWVVPRKFCLSSLSDWDEGRFFISSFPQKQTLKRRKR